VGATPEYPTLSTPAGGNARRLTCVNRESSTHQYPALGEYSGFVDDLPREDRVPGTFPSATQKPGHLSSLTGSDRPGNLYLDTEAVAGQETRTRQ
jgi:hypothetical protein